MKTTHLIVDGELSGTGIRDGINGGYLETSAIGVSSSLGGRISEWLERYENAHFFQFENADENKLLDKQGVDIARSLKMEFPDARITYFSNAELKEIPFDSCTTPESLTNLS
jgi:hypothetical protein